jgi:hypothetical protein
MIYRKHLYLAAIAGIVAVFTYVSMGEGEGFPSPSTSGGVLSPSLTPVGSLDGSKETGLSSVDQARSKATDVVQEEAAWWESEANLNDYFQEFDAKYKQFFGNGSLGFSDSLEHLKEFGDGLIENPDSLHPKILWQELGEIDGKGAYFVLQALRKSRQYPRPLTVDRAKEIQGYAPFVLTPQEMVSVQLGAIAKLDARQKEELERIYFAWIGVRARFEQQVSSAKAADRNARGNGRDFDPLPEDSEFFPASLAEAMQQVDYARSGYRGAISDFINKENLYSQYSE